MLKRAILSLAVLTALTLSVVGCEQGQYYGYAALNRNGDTIRIAVCEGIDATKLVFDVRGSDTGHEWVTVARYSGEHPFAAGDIVVLGEPVEGMEFTSSEQMTFRSGQEYALYVSGGSGWAMSWSSVDWESVGDQWLQVNHSPSRPAITEDPCPLSQD